MIKVVWYLVAILLVLMIARVSLDLLVIYIGATS